VSSSLKFLVYFAFAEIWSAMLESLFASPKSAIDPSKLPYIFFPSHHLADIFCDDVMYRSWGQQDRSSVVICSCPILSRNLHVS
jgi:hypothetical protein